MFSVHTCSLSLSHTHSHREVRNSSPQETTDTCSTGKNTHFSTPFIFCHISLTVADEQLCDLELVDLLHRKLLSTTFLFITHNSIIAESIN